jgi:hypothetical protein
MARSFTAQDLIVLPRVSAREAVVLITELVTVADAEAEGAGKQKLPPAIGRSKGRLVAALAPLDVATRPPGGQADTQAKRKADRAIDNAWSAFFDWLGGWCKLPPARNPHIEKSQAIFEMAFSGALGFTKLPYKIEWRESQARIDSIAAAKLDPTIKKLGGEAFWEHILETQEGYGRALHITTPKPKDAPAAEVRALLDAALDALRDYVTRVSAHADPDVPGSDALSEALLRPLTTWESRSAATGGNEEDAPEEPTEASAEAPAAEPTKDQGAP